MSNTKEPLERARREAQDLHKKIEASTATDHAALKADIQQIALEAQQIAASLKTIGEDQRADVKQHAKDAAAQLELLGKHAREAVGAGEAQIKQRNIAMLEQISKAVRSLSEAVAAHRSAAVKV